MSGNQLLVVDAGIDALIDSTMSDNEGYIMDSNNDLTIVSTKDSDIGSAEVSAGTCLILTAKPMEHNPILSPVDTSLDSNPDPTLRVLAKWQ